MSNIAALVARAPMRMGAQGDAVRQLQLALATLGYKLKGTGNFGGATDTAVVDFQRLRRLEADGVVGVRHRDGNRSGVSAVHSGGGGARRAAALADRGAEVADDA
jgi:peptidoglycan hydrolase-like protein with peptidoglycan-binding domain